MRQPGDVDHGHGPGDAREGPHGHVQRVVEVILDPGQRDPEGQHQHRELEVWLNCPHDQSDPIQEGGLCLCDVVYSKLRNNKPFIIII